MALASVTYENQSGGQTDYAFPFDYINSSDVRATVNGASAPFTLNGPSVVRFDTAPSGTVRIFRRTYADTRIVEFQNASVSSAQIHNLNSDQMFNLIEENASDVSESLTAVENIDDRVDGHEFRISQIEANGGGGGGGGGGTSSVYYETVNALYETAEGPRGAGSVWEAGPYIYREVVSNSDAHLTTDAGWPAPLAVVANDDGSVNVDAFGAGLSGNTSAAIQNAVNNFGKVVFSPGGYSITTPIMIPNGKTLTGTGSRPTSLIKSDNSTGSGSNTSPVGTPDSYAVNAIFIMTHVDGSYNFNASISDIELNGAAIADYGIYAPRLAEAQLNNLSINNCRTGFYARDCWMFNANRVTIRGNRGSRGFPESTTTRGWHLDISQNNGGGGGTSWSINGCWAHSVTIGWDISALSYSAFNACGADHTSNAYRFNIVRGVSLNSCGAEFADGAGPYRGIVLDVAFGVGFGVYGFYAWETSGPDNKAYMEFSGDSTMATLNGCFFEPFVGANPEAYNIVLQSGATLRSENCIFPSNGNGFISYTDGAVWIDSDRDGNTIHRAASNASAGNVVTRNASIRSDGSGDVYAGTGGFRTDGPSVHNSGVTVTGGVSATGTISGEILETRVVATIRDSLQPSDVPNNSFFRNAAWTDADEGKLAWKDNNGIVWPLY